MRDPIYAPLAYFYPRVVPGGAIAIDDYGFAAWPGCKTATDVLCDSRAATAVPLLYGNAAIFEGG
jgi:hypothetical protein